MKKPNLPRKKVLIVTLVVVVFIAVVVTALLKIDKDFDKTYIESGASGTKMTELQQQNLQKLCKVWGYVKYTHSAFLLGEQSWDDSLLELLPQVYHAKSDKEVNGILFEWLRWLGECNYKSYNRVAQWVAAAEEDKHYLADTAWLEDEAYLGADLHGALAEIPDAIWSIDRSRAPVQFDQLGEPRFSNESFHVDMDYSNGSYRLLGLFRVWNVFEYYFPYLDIIDGDWNRHLLEHIPIMLEGDDRDSYLAVLAQLTAKLGDNHVHFFNGKDLSNGTNFGIYDNKAFGSYSVPIDLIMAEGRIVVQRLIDSARYPCKLKPGDVILTLNGVDIDTVLNDRMNYISFPSREKALPKLSRYLLCSHENQMDITVLRGGEELSLSVSGYAWSETRPILEPYEILDNNIGLINPASYFLAGIDPIMEALADTDGLIIDLRQYPSIPLFTYHLPSYIVEKRTVGALFEMPSQAVPGVYVKMDNYYIGWAKESMATLYTKKVVVLMDEHTLSAAELSVMYLRCGENVTVMGSNSVGGDGDVTYIPLPGGRTLMYSSLGVFTPEGGQTQRIGVEPDIYVHRTIDGIKEGRDELMEAAIAFLKDER